MMNSNDWEIRESQRQRELEEAKGRAQQMEKTMKWWSECTSNWREKWAKVRNERNQSREEAKQLRNALENAIKDSNSYKREKRELEIQIVQLKKEMEKVHISLIKHAGQLNDSDREISESPVDRLSNDSMKNVNSEDGLVTKTRNFNEDGMKLDIDDYIQQGALPKEVNKQISIDEEEKQLIQKLSTSKSDDADDDREYLSQKVKMLQLRLDDAQKVINAEKEEKKHLLKTFDKYRQELDDYKSKCEDLRHARQEAVRELLTMQETHHAELRIVNNSLMEEVNTRETLERRLAEMRVELEKLQNENAIEWEKRERLETDKLNLEREVKKIKAEMMDSQSSRGSFGGMRTSGSSETELRILQQDLIEKNKEINDLRHSQSKMKKMLSEANVEIGHAVRRAEQYETEVKRLRSRVEELKKELQFVEDELDSASSAVRRLQRNNEELSARHSSPKSYNRTNSPKVQEYRPNINDLKQFYENKRMNIAPKSATTRHEEYIFDSKGRSEFEGVKQKFDRSMKPSNLCSNSNSRHSSKRTERLSSSKSSSSSARKSTAAPDHPSNPLDSNQSQLIASCSGYQSQSYDERDQIEDDMAESFNLDGLKVSDDDDDTS